MSLIEDFRKAIRGMKLKGRERAQMFQMFKYDLNFRRALMSRTPFK